VHALVRGTESLLPRPFARCRVLKGDQAPTPRGLPRNRPSHSKGAGCSRTCCSVARRNGRNSVNLADRLRDLAKRLPTGGSLTLTRDGLLELAATDEGQPDQPAAQPDFTIAELAARFHRSPSTIRGWCEHGRFKEAYKLNRRDWRIPSAALDGFLARQRGEPQEPLTELARWRAVRRAK
jgi:Helix-turn-helix domain